MRILVTIATHCAVCVAAALLAACGGGSGGRLNPSPGGVTAERTHVRPAYGVLYSFEGGSGDGEFPFAGLLNVKGTLYGTTYFGGATEGGTVFEITPSGTETVLYKQLQRRLLGRRHITGGGPHRRRRHALRHDLCRGRT